MSSKMTLSGDVDFQLIAKKTPGFVGADLSSLTKEAAVVAINRIFTRLRASPASPCAPTSASSSKIAVDGGKQDALSNGAVESGTAVKGLPEAVSWGSMATSVGERSTTASNAASPIACSGEGAARGVDVDNAGEGAAGGATEGAEAVGGFLAGPLSAAQLAPLGVCMEDFMAAVKKVTARAIAVRSQRRNRVNARIAVVCWLAVVEASYWSILADPIALGTRLCVC